MSTPMTPEATPNNGSLESASQRLLGLLSDDPETPQPESSQPEQQPKREKQERTTAKVAEQAPTAPETEDDTSSESEPAKEDESEEPPEAVAQPKTYRVKVDGAEVEVTEDELLNGYSRTQDYTRKTMELARQRKEFEERELAAVRQERELYRQNLTRIEDVLEAMTPKEPDWNQLRQTLSPERFADEVTAWQENSKRLTQVREERARIERQQADDAAKGFMSHLETQHTKLIEADPDFGDPTKAPAIQEELNAFATSRGFQPEEVAQVTDHRLVLLLRDAMRWQQHQAKAPKVENKIQAAIKPAAPGGSKANAPKSDKSAQAFQRLKQSGRVEDAGTAIEALL